jgi:hypothetical protein
MNKILRPVIVNELTEMMRGGPPRSVDPRIAYNQARTEFDRARGAVSPMGGVAKETPQPPRKALRP